VKIVFDTNVYVSQAMSNGAAHRVVEATFAARWRVFASESLLAELTRILRDKAQQPSWAVNAMIDRLRVRARLIPLPESRHHVLADSDDTPILQTALAAGADYLVSRDTHLLSLDPYEGLRIVSVASYYQMLELEGLI
jgi:uncharacterized protein